jgi:hypothetical protein
MPALRESSISFKFSGGVETKTDEKTAPVTKLLVLENVGGRGGDRTGAGLSVDTNRRPH